ncbi:MAG: hypothetical protein AAGJ81_08855 [Verrucomicrobiota bacterium]
MRQIVVGTILVGVEPFQFSERALSRLVRYSRPTAKFVESAGSRMIHSLKLLLRNSTALAVASIDWFRRLADKHEGFCVGDSHMDFSHSIRLLEWLTYF